MSQTPPPVSASAPPADIRERARREAEAIGITPAFISDMVEGFYDRVRDDAVLGPVFAGQIADEDWPSHLLTMKRFWASVLMKTGQYSGKPMQVHAQIPTLEEAHFSHWLELFEQTLIALNASEAARGEIMIRANRIAESFRLGLFFRPSN